MWSSSELEVKISEMYIHSVLKCTICLKCTTKNNKQLVIYCYSIHLNHSIILHLCLNSHIHMACKHFNFGRMTPSVYINTQGHTLALSMESTQQQSTTLTHSLFPIFCKLPIIHLFPIL